MEAKLLFCFEAFVLNYLDLLLMTVYHTVIPVNVQIKVPLYLPSISGLLNLVDICLKFLSFHTVMKSSDDSCFAKCNTLLVSSLKCCRV